MDTYNYSDLLCELKLIRITVFLICLITCRYLSVTVYISFCIDTSDFVSLVDQPLTIPMTTGLFENVCFQLAVNGDTVCEQSELYSVSVTPMNPLDMVTGLVEVDITILDDGDCEYVFVCIVVFSPYISFQ